MKIDWNQKYTTIAVYTIITATVIALVVTAIACFPFIAGFFEKLNEILMPVWLGLLFAYLMNPLVKLCEKYVFRFKADTAKRANLKRALSIVLTLIAVVLLLTVISLLIFPQVYISFIDLTSKLSGYISETAAFLDSISGNLHLLDELEKLPFFSNLLDFEKIAEQLQKLIVGIPKFIGENLPKVIGYFSGIASGFLNILLGIFFSIYFSASKERLLAQVKKVLRALTSTKVYDGIISLAEFTHKTFGVYITGKLLDSMLVGILCCIVCSICRIPYALLISVIIAICNIIPLAGPIIGAVPGVFIVFIVDPIKALWFIVIIVVIMQLDGNVIEPKVLGEATGLASVWVLFSITVMGGLFGIVGMIIAVPIFALLYAILKTLIEHRLTSRSLPTSTEEYIVRNSKE